MDVTAHIEELQREGERMADALATTAADAAVPSCPEWTVRDLVHHLGGVHRWATSFVAEAKAESGDNDFELAMGTPPDDAHLVEWLAQGHGALVAALRAARPDLACWSFMPAPSPLAFWARRQAHETAIHRVDAELAAGRSLTGVGPAFGADGLDEFLTGFVPRRRARGSDTVRTLLVSCDDAPASWRVTIGPDGMAAAAGKGPADCVLRGGATDLFYAVWNRRSIDGLSLEGDPEVLEQLLGRVQVRWS
jgi:uncharacterized protein (TIGR03083 family)